MSYEEGDQSRQPHDVLTCPCLICACEREVEGWSEMTDGEQARVLVRMFG